MTFGVKDLTDTLLKNKANHTKIYEKALVDWRKAAVKEHAKSIKQVQKQIKYERERFERQMASFEKQIQDLEVDIVRCKEGKNPRLHTVAVKPEHRKEEYTNVISMLKMTTATEIELDNDQFSCYVQDKWVWQKQFLRNATQLFCSGSMDTNLGTGGHYYLNSVSNESNEYMLDLYGSEDE
jgi:hypothetical protein